jgi:hypothetical protein
MYVMLSFQTWCLLSTAFFSSLSLAPAGYALM